MITITFEEVKKKLVKTLCLDSLDKASEKLAEIGPKPKTGESTKGRKYVLIAVSWETKSEKNLCLPYIFPEEEED